jgi:hypothetical protein
MKVENTAYPQYRKYKSNTSYFKIISPELFEEIKVLGNKKTLHTFEAKILPDRNYIKDLTFNYKDYWIICKKSDYEELRETLYS